MAYDGDIKKEYCKRQLLALGQFWDVEKIISELTLNKGGR
jgi:hypothetical protein